MTLRDEVIKTIDAVIDHYFNDLPLDVLMLATKTENYYVRVLSKGVRDLYNNQTTEDDLLDTMIRLLDEQLRRAWNEGARENGWEMPEDMTDEWEGILQDIINSEFDHVEQFIADVVAARDAGEPIEPLIARAELWASRYNDVVNRAVIETADKEERLEWVLGATEEHCETCAALNGIVASADEWAMSGFQPQNPPNNALECGGWRCDCALVPTDKRRTAGRFDKWESLFPI